MIKLSRLGRLWLSMLVCAAALLVTLSALPRSARAAGNVYIVTRTDDGFYDFGCGAIGSGCTLRGAITAANNNPGSTIKLTHNATYVLTNTASGQLNVTADLTVTTDLICIGLLPCPAIIRGNPGWNTRIFNINSGARVVMSNLTIRGGNIPDGSTGMGGGIYNGGDLTLSGTTLYTNSVKTGDLEAYGGGLANFGTLTIYGGSFQANLGYDVGGGLYNAPGRTVYIYGTKFIGNWSLNGGAIGNVGNLTIDNAIVQSNQSPNAQGGGLFNDMNAHLWLNDTVILSNTAYSGAGLANFGNAQLNRATLQGNQAANIGGGLATYGFSGILPVIAMTDTVLTGNSAQTQGGGAFIYGDAVMQVYRSQIKQNQALLGGGLYFSGSLPLKIEQTLIATNTAVTDGGGLYADAYARSVYLNHSEIRGNGATTGRGGGIFQAYKSNTMFITNTTLSHNYTLSTTGFTGGGALYTNAYVKAWNSTFSHNNSNRDGGAIKNNNGQIELNNVTLSGNYAARDGGALESGGSAWVSLANVTVAGNVVARAGGGISNTGTLHARNSLFGGNQAPGGGWDCAGMLNSGDYNLIEHTGGCAITGGGHDITGYGNQFDPELKDNGGPTWTHLLWPNSVAFGGGNPAGCLTTLGGPQTTDQRGLLRPLGARCDIGAVEMGAVIYLPLTLR